MSGWTAAMCERCWDVANPNREPVRVVDADAETCHACGGLTFSGIFIRKDPREQNYPTPKKDDE